MKFKHNLDDPDFMEAKEAAEKWGISDSRIRQRINEFPEGQKRKFGKQWVVTRQGMEMLFGEIKTKEMSKMEKYIINYHTGVLHEIEAIHLAAAQERAYDGIAYTQENITVETLDGQVLSIARWYGTEPEEDDEVLAEVGEGFYSNWSEEF